MLLTTAAIAAPTYIHAGRLMAVPGQAVRGPSTIVVMARGEVITPR